MQHAWFGIFQILGKFCPKIPNCLFKVKLGIVSSSSTYAKFNGDVHFFCFGPETPFFGKFGPES